MNDHDRELQERMQRLKAINTQLEQHRKTSRLSGILVMVTAIGVLVLLIYAAMNRFNFL